MHFSDIIQSKDLNLINNYLNQFYFSLNTENPFHFLLDTTPDNIQEYKPIIDLLLHHNHSKNSIYYKHFHLEEYPQLHLDLSQLIFIFNKDYILPQLNIKNTINEEFLYHCIYQHCLNESTNLLPFIKKYISQKKPTLDLFKILPLTINATDKELIIKKIKPILSYFIYYETPSLNFILDKNSTEKNNYSIEFANTLSEKEIEVKNNLKNLIYTLFSIESKEIAELLLTITNFDTFQFKTNLYHITTITKSNFIPKNTSYMNFLNSLTNDNISVIKEKNKILLNQNVKKTSQPVTVKFKI